MQSLMEELSGKARALSPADRARLAEDLLQSLDDEPASEVEAAWDAEIEGRVAQIKAGTAKLVSAADVHAEARRIYRCGLFGITIWRVKNFFTKCANTRNRDKYFERVSKANMKKTNTTQDHPASELISKRIAELGDWRGETLGRMRQLILQADTDVVEEWKWMGTPVWSHDGIICTGESYKDKVKLTFAKGASLKDPAHLFNASLDGNVRRAIDIHEGEEVDESAFKAVVRQAVALNSSGKSKPSKKAKS